MGRPYGGKSFPRTERPTGNSSAVTAVLFSRGNDTLHQETKQGSYIYSGEAGKFHEWEFRTRLRSRGKRGDFYIDAVSRITEGLRGDAFIVAQEVGLEQLIMASRTRSSSRHVRDRSPGQSAIRNRVINRCDARARISPDNSRSKRTIPTVYQAVRRSI